MVRRDEHTRIVRIVGSPCGVLPKNGEEALRQNDAIGNAIGLGDPMLGHAFRATVPSVHRDAHDRSPSTLGFGTSLSSPLPTACPRTGSSITRAGS